MQAAEEIPRKRLLFSNAGNEICKGITKKNDGDAICGLVALTGSGIYYILLLMVTPSGRNDGAIIASSLSANSWCLYTDNNGTHSYSTTHYNPVYDSLSGAIDYLKSININNLPILNELTKKDYIAHYTGSAGRYYCTQAVKDLLDYYYGVI